MFLKDFTSYSTTKNIHNSNIKVEIQNQISYWKKHLDNPTRSKMMVQIAWKKNHWLTPHLFDCNI